MCANVPENMSVYLNEYVSVSESESLCVSAHEYAVNKLRINHYGRRDHARDINQKGTDHQYRILTFYKFTGKDLTVYSKKTEL